MQKAKVLIQPSPVEGFGIVILEANSCGTPVVVSSGIPQDVVINNYNGFRYPFGDLKDFALKIVRLIEDESLWTRISKNAYKWAQKFSWKNSVLEFNKLLQSLEYKKN